MGTPERSDHISTKSVLFKVGLKVPTPKHEVVAAEGTAKGGRIGEDLFHQQGGGIQSREQKTVRTQRHYIKQAAQVGNRVKNSSVTMPGQIPDLS